MILIGVFQMKIIQLTVIFEGDVQGVFFRQHVKQFADKYKVCGYVKNLNNGSVEMIAVADKDTLEKFLNEIQNKPGFGSIKNINKKFSEKSMIFEDFKIIY